MKKLGFVLLIILSFAASLKAQNLNEVIKFIKDNPQKASVYLIENEQTTINYNGTQIMPLASAVKTIIAIEFAKQVASKKIDQLSEVALTDLAKYYLPNTDGNAHPNWIKAIKKAQTDSVTLLAIAKGMIRHSSNANTEYLQDLLGLTNINKNLKTLALKNHEPLFYFGPAALMVCAKPTEIAETDWLAQLNAMPIATYLKKCEAAHLQLKTNPEYLASFNRQGLSAEVQKIWSDRIVGATTLAYASLMQKINSRTYFNAQTQAVLESIMEWPMEFDANKKTFNRLGQKGGSTAFVLTDAFYATNKIGLTLACAFFFNNLSLTESALINKNFAAFEANILNSKKFREELAIALK